MKTDLRIVFGVDAQGAVTVDLALGPSDLETVSGRENLRQALALRLLVAQGELAALGHPEYGSRLHELIGEPLDDATVELLRRHIRQSLLDDPRVADVVAVHVVPRADNPGAVDIDAVVKPITGEDVHLAASMQVT